MKRSMLLGLWLSCVALADAAPAGELRPAPELPPLPAPQFTHGNLQSSSGEFVLSWSLSGGLQAGLVEDDSGNRFVRIEEWAGDEDQAQWWPHPVTGDEQRFAVYEPGERRYRLRACLKLGWGDACGDPSEEVSVRILASAVDSREVVLRSDLPAAETRESVQLGANVLQPGPYSSSITEYNGWFFGWAQNSHDLILIWNTYRDFAGPNPAAGEENLQPVWLIANLNADPWNPSVFIGSLIYKQVINSQEIDSIVGQVRVEMNGATAPRVRWYIPDGSFYRNTIRWVVDDLQFSPGLFGVPQWNNPHDHFQGMWISENQPIGNNFGWISYITGDFEFGSLFFYDQAGHPIWGTAVNDGFFSSPRVAPTAAMEGRCLSTVGNAWYPDVPMPAGRQPVIHWLGNGCNGGAGQWNMRRSYGPLVAGPLQPGGIELRLTVPHALRGASRNLFVGSWNAPAPIVKLVGNHEVRFQIGTDLTAIQCALNASGQCPLSLNYFSEGNYPSARVFRVTRSGNTWVNPNPPKLSHLAPSRRHCLAALFANPSILADFA